MKKLVIVLIILIGMAICLPVFAQDSSDNRYSDTDIYYVNIPVEKIYTTSYGYIVLYRKGVNQIGRVAIPNEWFMLSAGKSEIITLPRGKNWPSMSVFYKDGEFSHVRLYVHRVKSHETWGNLSIVADVRGMFEGVETLQLEF
ncbi:MAG: hypothetical protein FWG99_05100 [Treponema sp.]|nr:hypothetical protein [Treponema sp.]